MRPIAVAVEREEVVPVVGDVVAQLLGPDRGIAELRVVALLGVELGGDPDRADGRDGVWGTVGLSSGTASTGR